MHCVSLNGACCLGKIVKSIFTYIVSSYRYRSDNNKAISIAAQHIFYNCWHGLACKKSEI